MKISVPQWMKELDSQTIKNQNEKYATLAGYTKDENGCYILKKVDDLQSKYAKLIRGNFGCQTEAVVSLVEAIMKDMGKIDFSIPKLTQIKADHNGFGNFTMVKMTTEKIYNNHIFLVVPYFNIQGRERVKQFHLKIDQSGTFLNRASGYTDGSYFNNLNQDFAQYIFLNDTEIDLYWPPFREFLREFIKQNERNQEDSLANLL